MEFSFNIGNNLYQEIGSHSDCCIREMSDSVLAQTCPGFSPPVGKFWGSNSIRPAPVFVLFTVQ
jgi:hypothetical protein